MTYSTLWRWQFLKQVKDTLGVAILPRCIYCNRELRLLKDNFYQCILCSKIFVKENKSSGYISIPKNAKKPKPFKLFPEEDDSIFKEIAEDEGWKILDEEPEPTFKYVNGKKVLTGFRSKT